MPDVAVLFAGCFQLARLKSWLKMRGYSDAGGSSIICTSAAALCWLMLEIGIEVCLGTENKATWKKDESHQDLFHLSCLVFVFFFSLAKARCPR